MKSSYKVIASLTFLVLLVSLMMTLSFRAFRQIEITAETRKQVESFNGHEAKLLAQHEAVFTSGMRSLFIIIVLSNLVMLILTAAFIYLIYRESQQQLKNVINLENERLLAVQEATNTQLLQTNEIFRVNEETTRKLVSELEVFQIEMDTQNTELRRSQEELQTQQIELELQNDELQQARESLEVSRNKYTELYDFAPVGYFTFDEHGVIREVNLAGAQMLGIERSRLTDTPFASLITDEAEQGIFSGHLSTVVQGLGIQRCEFKLKGKDHTEMYALVQSVCIDTIDDKGRYILSSVIDSTASKKLEAEIQDAREYSENIVETLHKPLIVMSSDLKILTANRNFYETFKVTPEETIGNFIYDLGNRQWDIPKLRVLFEDILPNDSVFNGYEVDHHFPGIGRKIFLLNARQIVRKNIGSHIILLAMEDHTERKLIEAERVRLERVLQDKNTELVHATLIAERASRAKSDFLSSMSHELRTPLSAILGFAQLIESGEPVPTSNQKRSIDQILKAGWYLLELINEILDLAVIESGNLLMSLETVALSEIMHECEAMIEPQAEKRGIKLHFAHIETDCYVKADRTRAKQVLINLLSNAIKYNRADGRVTVDAVFRGADIIRISVRDTGEGLAPEQVAKLFQPFNRLGQETSTEQGTGIGLVVCKRLVEWMGGTINAESTVGEGSVFWFELNLTTEPPLANHTDKAVSASPEHLEGEEPLYTVLYVEDNPANLMLVEDIIARRPDIRLVSAGDSKRGIELARSAMPDVILMDIHLPGMSGVDAMKILVADAETGHIPVIALSANAIPRDIEKGLKAGFFRYLTKPVKVIEFMDTIDLALKFAKIKKSGYRTSIKKEQT